MTTTFLTGATGFVGASVARLLLDKGHKIRALSRPNNDRRNLAGLDIEIVEGDLAHPHSYIHALKGCDNLFHVAADYRIWVPDAAAMHRINIDGTRALMLAALDAGVEKIIYTSSVAALGINKDGTPSHETTPVSYTDMVGVYKQSKYLAEQEVSRLISTHKLPAVIVNPSTPIGPRDIKPTPTGRIIVDAARGKMPAYVDTGLNIAHVEDVAMGHYLALAHGKIGERYILGGENLSLANILGIIAEITGGKPPKIKLPRAALYPVAAGMELIARTATKLGRQWEPMVTIDALKMSKKKMYFTAAKATRDIGYTPRPARDAIADAITWFKANGYC